MLRISLASVSAAQALFSLCTVVIASALLLGGGTRVGYLSDSVLQVLAVPLLLVAVWRLADLSLGKPVRWSLIFCLAVVALPLLQLVPLPPSIWTALPNRGVIAAGFHLLGRELPWMPISVSPHATWLSALSLLVPLAIFAGIVQLDYRRRRFLSLVILALGIVGIFLGLMQVSQGASSGLTFFDAGNAGEVVGFFANRNHFAALLYALTLFAAAWATDMALRVGSTRNRKNYETTAIMALIASFTVLVVLVAAQGMVRSRAGLALTIVALLGAFCLALTDRRSVTGVTPTRLLLGATAIAVIFASQFALYRVMERFAVDPLQNARIRFVHTSLEAAKAFMPVGSGMGTFVPVYALFEKPADVIPNTYVNRAHNDPLEVWLESGVLGLALMAIFAVWFVARSWQIWRQSPGGREIDQGLARAATLVIALLCAHSFVDYPLRTGAMTAIMAFACALLIEPPDAPKESLAQYAPSGAEASFRSPIVDQPQRPVAARWGEDLEWPAAWTGSKQRPSDFNDK